MSACRKPCQSCPWRTDQHADAIPFFKLELAEGLANTCASEQGGKSVELGQPMFACHQSREGEEIVCAGWLAVEGIDHNAARLNVGLGKWNPGVFHPGDDWPELHQSFAEVIEKLRADCAKDDPDGVAAERGQRPHYNNEGHEIT